MTAANTLAAKIAPRSTERVKIVLSVPWWSSVATMSPATSAAISGNRNAEPKSSSTSGVASPVS